LDGTSDLGSPFPPDFHVVLASRSPRRHSLLRDLGVPFTAALSEGEERSDGGAPRQIAESNALSKIDAVAVPADLSPGTFILGTDTLVVADNRVMGKPHSAEEATSMLTRLSGRSHKVVSGVALRRSPRAGAPRGSEETRIASASTRVTFLPLGPEDVEAYIASGEWRGKAGAYAVQGLAALFVSEVRGEYSNVVGLPLCLVATMFRDLGFDLLQRRWL
jgi:septum formation protein